MFYGDGDYTYCGEHGVMYIIVQSLGCTPGTNIILYANFTSIKKSVQKKGERLRW